MGYDSNIASLKGREELALMEGEHNVNESIINSRFRFSCFSRACLYQLSY